MNDASQPPWLHEELEIVALLHAALDRFDRQPGELRQRNVVLPVERYLRSLARGDGVADQTWAQVQELARRGVLAIGGKRRGPYEAQWSGAKLSFAPACEPLLRSWLARARVEPVMDVWRAAVQHQAPAFPGGCEALLNRRIAIADRTADEVVAAFARLNAVRAPATLRQLSAHAFWGDSKVLDDREELVASLFPNLQIRERPIVVSVFLPAAIDNVLFIENQDAYTEAVAGRPAACAAHALVYIAGFRSTAARIRRAEGVCLHFAGESAGRPAFERWWFEGGMDGAPCERLPTYFWGDLDFAGLQMLKVLRQRFDALSAWRPGYEPMLDLLRKCGGRVASVSEQHRQVDPGATGCTYADEVLLPAIRQRGFCDQERLADALPEANAG